MTANDNIRHYIGDLETTEDIDVVFKHIYDLMLANGGEGSGLNADMVDGYHASDFAPASLKDEIDNCIHSITIGGTTYSGAEVILALLANDVFFERESTSESQDVESFLNEIEGRVKDSEDSLSAINVIAAFLSDERMRKALMSLIQNNLQIVIGDDGGEQYYFDANSVNGLSFQIVTQAQYDLLSNEKKLDPRNIYIINNDIDECFNKGKYAPPSILQAGMNLEFRLNTETKNIEFSVDGRPRYVYQNNEQVVNPLKTWKVLLPLVGNGVTEDGKGLLYPEWFNDIKNVMTSEDLLNQENYPFLLNTPETKASLIEGLIDQNKITKITIGENVITPESVEDPNADITNALDSYVTSWIASHIASIQSQLEIDDIEERLGLSDIWDNFNNYETLSHKQTTISGNGNANDYPSTSAIVNYIKNGVQAQIASLQESINGILANTVTSAMGIISNKSDTKYPTTQAVYDFVLSKIPSIVQTTTVDSGGKDKGITSKATNSTVPSTAAVYQFVKNYVTDYVSTYFTKTSSVSFTKASGNNCTNLVVKCTEHRYGYDISISCDKWVPKKADDTLKLIGSFSKSLVGSPYYTHALACGYMDIRIAGKNLYFKSSSGIPSNTCKCKLEVNTHIYILK